MGERGMRGMALERRGALRALPSAPAGAPEGGRLAAPRPHPPLAHLTPALAAPRGMMDVALEQRGALRALPSAPAGAPEGGRLAAPRPHPPLAHPPSRGAASAGGRWAERRPTGGAEGSSRQGARSL